MDTSMEDMNPGQGQQPVYVSCITCDGRPILPPLMTDARRMEMRQYKEQAVQVEMRLRASQVAKNDSNKENESSTPPSRGKHERKLSYTLLEPSAALLAACTSGTVAGKEENSVQVSSAIPHTRPSEIEININSEDPTESDKENRHSPIPAIRRHVRKLSFTTSLETNFAQTSETASIAPAQVDTVPASGSESEESSVILSLSVTPQKADVERSVKYFDDCESTQKRNTENIKLATKHPLVGFTNTFSEVDGNVMNREEKSPGELSSSLNHPITRKLGGTKRYFEDYESSQESLNGKEDSAPPSPSRSTGKLSYTLSEPSAGLSAALANCRVVDNEDNDSVHESESVSRMPSFPATPLKSEGECSSSRKYFEDVEATPTNQELDIRLNALNRHLAQLQVGLGINKQEHLERYLGEVAAEMITQSSDNEADNEVEYRFKKLKDTHEKQMAELIKMHNAQQLQLKKAFERQRSLLLMESQSYSIRSAKFKNGSELEYDSFVSSPTAYQKYGLSIVPEDKDDDTAALSVASIPFTTESRPSTAQVSSRTEKTTTTITSSHNGAPESLVNVKLSKLQVKMQSMSPNVFRVPADARSPLLKGLTFPDPLERPRNVIKIPPKALDPTMKPKFCRVTATVRGYLVRRLLRTEKLQIIVQTIRDTVDLLLKLYEEAPSGRPDTRIKPQDLDLHRRSLQQLTGACSSFHDVFFKLSTTERMAIISTDRERLKNKALKHESMPNNNTNSSVKRNISAATLKAIERRISATNPTLLTSHEQNTANVSSRSQKRLNDKVSPKRRRLSHFVQPSVTKTISRPARDSNANTWRLSEQHRASNMNATYTRGPSQSVEPYRIDTNFNRTESSNSDVIFSTDPHFRPSTASRPATANTSCNSTCSTSSARFNIGHSENEKKKGRKSVAHRTPWK